MASFDTDFSGLGDGAWPSGTYTDDSDTGGSVAVVSGQGDVSGGGITQVGRVYSVIIGTSVEITYEMAGNGSTVYSDIGIVSDPVVWTGEDADDCYYIYHTTQVSPQLYRVVSGVFQSIGAAVGAVLDATPNWYKISYDASTGDIKWKRWTGVLGDEPGTWNVESNDTSHQGNSLRYFTTNYDEANLFDRIIGTDLDAASGATVTHSTNALLQASVETSHNTDALLQSTVTVTHTTDAVLAQTLRFVYPTSDVAATGWDTAPTGSQSLFAQLDEEPADSADYVFPVIV